MLFIGMNLDYFETGLQAKVIWAVSPNETKLRAYYPFTPDVFDYIVAKLDEKSLLEIKYADSIKERVATLKVAWAKVKGGEVKERALSDLKTMTQHLIDAKRRLASLRYTLNQAMAKVPFLMEQARKFPSDRTWNPVLPSIPPLPPLLARYERSTGVDKKPIKKCKQTPDDLLAWWKDCKKPTEPFQLAPHMTVTNPSVLFEKLSKHPPDERLTKWLMLLQERFKSIDGMGNP